MKDRPVSPQSVLAETLTRREMQILNLLAQDLTNQEIAKAETLAISSVKWYLQQIYGKLGVKNRREAIQKAMNLDLLASTSPGALRQSEKDSLPSGIVTFLFTDIEGSTPLWERMPAAMKESVANHHALLRQAIESNGGHVSQIVGDAFQAAFRLAADGLRAALAAQHFLQEYVWGKTGPLRVRMGLHTGSAELDPLGDAPYAVGYTLNRTARIMAAGHGGQILLSQETRDLVVRELPEGVSLKDLGDHKLKGLDLPEHLYQVYVPALVNAFPPLNSDSHQPHNLPHQLTSFIGREQEIAEVSGLLQKHRMVTLTGSGGVGKTRLSLQVATGVLGIYPHGVWFVELASLANPELIPQAVAAVLGLQKSGESDYLTIITSYLREKRLLLVLDNCEHLLGACAAFVHPLLLRCPQVSVLATSREPLGVDGEARYRVPSMDTLDLQPFTDLQEFTRVESIRLFAERASMIQADFNLNNETLPVIANICRRLDGIPLAIELAAARVDMLSVSQIAGRLDDSFRLFVGGSSTAVSRQKTLRASIDWSYNLLSEPERLVLQRLSVFSGGWSLEAAEAVCSGGGLEAWDVLDILGWLLKKSLILADNNPGGPVRYRMLEMIRQYALEKLADSGQEAVLRDRHVTCILSMAQEYGPLLKTAQINEILPQLDSDLDNLRAAITWSLSKGNQQGSEQALEILVALDYYWSIRGLYWESFPRFLQAFKDIPEHDSASIELKGWGFYVLSYIQTDHNIEPETLGYLNQSVHLFRQTNHRQGLALALSLRSYLTFRHDFFYTPTVAIRKEEAERDQDESFAIVQELSQLTDSDSQWVKAWVNCWNGAGEVFHQNYTRACVFANKAIENFISFGDVIGELYGWVDYNVALAEEGKTMDMDLIHYNDRALDLARRINHKWYQELFLQQKAYIYYRLELYPEFEASILPALTLAQQIGQTGDEISFYEWLGIYEIVKQDYQGAKSNFHIGLTICKNNIHRYFYNVLGILTGLAELDLFMQQYDRAFLLLGFIEEAAKKLPKRTNHFNRDRYERCEEKAQALESAVRFLSERQRGQAMTLEQVVNVALNSMEE